MKRVGFKMAAKAPKNFLFGCDPELFVKNKDDKYVSAAGLIPGTKDKPYKVPGGAIQVDGMAAEFNIDPVDNYLDWNKNINLAMSALKEFLPADHSLAIVPSVVFDKDVFEKSPDIAKELGCTPDFDAWTGQQNPPPQDPDNPYLRTASGHLHVGWRTDADLSDQVHMMHCRDAAKQFDWYLGAWSVHLDTDARRRKLYGKAGAFRPKSYGFEYRVLSNFWLANEDRRLGVWNRMMRAIQDMRITFLPEYYPPEESATICDYINQTKRNKSLEAAHRFPLIEI
jgi:hypothetical protein